MMFTVPTLVSAVALLCLYLHTDSAREPPQEEK